MDKLHNETTLENANLLMRLDAAGRLTLTDKRCGAAWQSMVPVAGLRMGATDKKPGRRLPGCAVKFCSIEGGVRGLLRYCRRGSEDIELEFDLTLDTDSLCVALHPMRGLRRDEIVEIELPRGLGWASPGEHGYLVLPLGLGALCDFSERRPRQHIEHLIYSGGQTGVSLPFFGVRRGDHALAGIVDTPFDCKLAITMNAGRRKAYSITPVWVVEERLNYERRMHYVPQADGDYVTIAKRYRRELIERGEYVSLREKGEGCPEVDLTMGAVLGHRHLALSEPEGADLYDQRNAYGFFREAARAGFDRVVAHNVLWGDLGDAKRAAGFARSLSPGFHLSVYQNYVDLFQPGEEPLERGAARRPYPKWDEGLVARLRNGDLRPNWRVRRKGLPDIWTRTVCSARRLEVAVPQLRQILETFGRGSVYIDVEGAVPLFECFSGAHPVTREQDCRHRLELLREVKRLFGAVSTEAAPLGCLAPAVEVGSYFSVYQYSGHGNSLFRILPPLIPIPLHPLVFHGSVVNQTAVGDGFYQCHAPHVPLYGFLPDTLDEKGLRVSYQMRGACYAELVEHRFLTGPRVVINENDSFQCDDVQWSRFSDGTIVVGNFASLPFLYEGRWIPPMDFLILHEGLDMKVTAKLEEVAPGEALTIELRMKNEGSEMIEGAGVGVVLRGAVRQTLDLEGASLPSIPAGEELGRHWSISVPEDANPGPLVVIVTATMPTDGEPKQAVELACVQIQPTASPR